MLVCEVFCVCSAFHMVSTFQTYSIRMCILRRTRGGQSPLAIVV